MLNPVEVGYALLGFEPLIGPAAEWLGVQFGALREMRGGEAERGALAAAALVALVTGLQIINAWFIEGTFLNMSDTWNVPTFASSGLFLVAGIATWRTARKLTSTEPERRIWLVISVIMFAFSVEVIADLHSKLENTGNLHTFILILTPLVALAVSLAMARPLTRLAPPAPLLLIAAAGFIVISQVVAAYDSSVAVTGDFRNFLILVEEVGEMVSPCLVLVAAIHARPTNQS